ncbi:septation protein SepH [Rhodococcus sp. NPDC058514]|uniref:septation protein SepH n=1 Tax=unclassified Rhodococcus (in: high G+C Gram-positive bacteria) TaxID=192944 RepID=UPI003666C594
MRELRVIGLEPDGTHVVCADNESGERFRVPADDKLRAASRGDVARFGQIEIETESRIRPRDIQARIRSGATVEQVATEAGVSIKKIESFAHPVLLERSRAAEMAQAGHPVRENGPTVLTLAEIVGLAFRARGHNLDEAEWDAWRDEEGHWIAQLEWQAGRTRNAAHWRFQPDSHGGTIAPLDAAATDLIDPDFGRPLRGLAPIAVEDPYAPALDAVIEAEVEVEADEYESLDEPGAMDSLFHEEDTAPEDDDDHRPKPAPQHQGAKDKRGKPALPSWDDVLLGVRSSGRG